MRLTEKADRFFKVTVKWQIMQEFDSDYRACIDYTLLPLILAINYFGRWWSQKLLKVTTFKYSSFFPKDKLCSFYPKNYIFTFVVGKKVWKLEMLSVLSEFPAFCGKLFIPQLHAITNCCLHSQRWSCVRAEQRLPGWEGGHSAKLWHSRLARHPGQMRDSCGRSIANQKGALMGTLAPLRVSSNASWRPGVLADYSKRWHPL